MSSQKEEHESGFLSRSSLCETCNENFKLPKSDILEANLEDLSLTLNYSKTEKQSILFN